MPIPSPVPARIFALSAGAIAATGVAGQRVGLGLAVAVLLALGAGLLGARRRASPGLAVLAAALAAQPVLRDAGWLIALDVGVAFVAAAAAVSAPEDWPRVGRALLAPSKLFAVTRGVRRAAGPSLTMIRPGGRFWPIVRGIALAAVLTVIFASLFATGDRAFAVVLKRVFTVRLDVGALAWRVGLAIVFVASAAVIARAGAATATAADRGLRWLPGRIELLIALGSVVALFATFVVVQLRVLFGGAGYVRASTGLGYGDYARSGFVQLLVVAGLTLAVVAVAARRRDRWVRGLLGALCVLSLVILLSADHRLNLVESAYGFTRVRYAGHAVVVWLAAVFGLVLSAGASPAVARRIHRLAVTITVGAVLILSLSNPDARIAQRAVDRAAAGRPIDRAYLAGLSADAVPALERLPAALRGPVLRSLRARLARPDGLAGLNLSRARAR